MAIKQTINEIILTRQSVKDEFLGYADKVKEMESFVRAIRKIASSTGWQQMLSHNEKLKSEWEKFSKNVDELAHYLKELKKDDLSGVLVECLKRVQREYLNIGGVGPWRQGKSTVISELSNLDDYVIPRSKFEACTGTTINVFNGEEEVWNGKIYEKKGGNKAVIFFYSFKEICSLINEYLTSLGFKTIPMTQNAEILRSKCAEYKSRYENQAVPNGKTEIKKMLLAYLGHVDEYVTYLRSEEGESRTIENLSQLESRKELRPFVSYYEHPDTYYEENQIDIPPRIHRVLAVKNVNIYTDFQLCGEDVGKIQFLDTPGIGESKIGVNQALAYALRQELDIAICLKKVRKGVDNTDSYEFHKLLRTNVHGRNPENWIFYLFNICEDNVTTALANATITPILHDLSSVSLENGAQGISLRNNSPEDPSHPNHVATMNILCENGKLQEFFYNILKEMSNTILATDESFYSEARNLITKCQAIYSSKIISNLLEVTRSLPTFDDRENIQNIISEVESEWNHVLDNGKNDFSLDKSIQEALKLFYDEPLGCQFAKSFLTGHEAEHTITDEQIKTLRDSIERLNKTEATKSERRSKRDQLIQNLLLPAVSDRITEIMFMANKCQPQLTHWTEDLEKNVLSDAMALIDDRAVMKKMADIKSVFWSAFKKKGHLEFISNDDSTWLNEFLLLLKEGGSDFKDLHDCLYEFNNQRIDLREQIYNIINNTTSKIIKEYTDYGQSPDFTKLEGVRLAYYTCLINKENKIKFLLKTDFENTVGKQVQKAEQTFITSIVNFITQIIPSHRPVTEYAKIYEQLIKFYHKYSAYIFTNDLEKEQKIAAQEWNVFVQKYTK